VSFIELDVPFVSQNDIGGHAGHVHHSEQNGCWYASTCMVSYFWEAGPRLGVPEQYARDPSDPDPMGKRYVNLKRNENFEGVPLPANKKWTAQVLMRVLGQHGPCYVRRGFRDSTTGDLVGGHAIVLVGSNITADQVAILDPWETTRAAGRKLYSLAEFNDFFKWTEDWATGISLMYKKQQSASAAANYIATKRLPTWLVPWVSARPRVKA
jgi:hypothetical protein